MEIINRKPPYQIVTICLLVSIINLLPIIINTPLILLSKFSGVIRAALLANSLIHLALLSWLLLMFYRGKRWAMYLIIATLASNIIYYAYLLLTRESYTSLQHGYAWVFAILNFYTLSLSLTKRSQSYFQSPSVRNLTQFLRSLTSAYVTNTI